MPSHRLTGHYGPAPDATMLPGRTLSREALLAEAARRGFSKHLSWSEADIERWIGQILESHPGHQSDVPRETIAPRKGKEILGLIRRHSYHLRTIHFGTVLWERIALWIWRLAIFVLLSQIVFELRGQNPQTQPPNAPSAGQSTSQTPSPSPVASMDRPALKPISIEDREPIKDLQFRAAMALARLNEAMAKRAQADLDADRSQRDLDIANQQIDSATNSLRVKYSAPVELWNITPGFLWEAKKALPMPQAGNPQSPAPEKASEKQ